MAREFGNKGGRGGKPAGRAGGTGSRSGGGRSSDSSRSGGRSGSRSGGTGRSSERSSAGRPPARDGEKRPYAPRSGGGRSDSRGDSRSEGRGSRSDRPARSYDDKPRAPRSYGSRDDRPRQEEGGRDFKPRRPREDGERSSYPKRDFGDRPARPRRDDRDGERDFKPRRPRDDGDRKSYGRTEERADHTPRRYMRDEESSPRKPRREDGERYPARKPFKGRFDEENTEAAPRERKPRMGADKLDTGRLKVSIKANLWGQHAVKAAWLNPERTISALYTTPDELKLFAPVMEEARAAGIHRPEPTLVGREDLDKYLPRDAVHQGVAITAAEPEEVFIQDIINKAAAKERSVVMILDQVTDPHNVGAIIRSACALGADGVIMQRRHAPELTGVVSKAACGAIEHVMVAYETNLSRSIEALQAAGYTVAGLDERGEQTVESLKNHQKLVLVLGAEGPGLRHLVKEHCDLLVKIDMPGPIPSLNVSNAAAVALYAAVA